MKKILILNGPNLNLVGTREPQIYGSRPMVDVIADVIDRYPELDIRYEQSNHEGDLIDAIHEAGADPDMIGIVLNAGAYTHTSLAIHDAILSVDVPVVEIHMSNVAGREEIRRRSLIAPECKGSIAGFGADSYRLGVEALLHL